MRCTEEPLTESTQRRGPFAALAEAWRRIQADPVGILGPCMMLLLIQSACMMVWWRQPTHWGGDAIRSGIGLWALQAVVAVPLRAATLAAGARAGGRACAGLARTLPLFGATLLVGAAQLAVVSVLVAVGLAGAGLMLSYGFTSVASIWGALVMFVGVGAVFLIRVGFAFVPHRVVCGGHSGLLALGFIPRASLASSAATILVLGDVATGLGALLCGAGALPGYPLSDLALMVLWEDT